jgi:hypothetical protein
MSFGETMTMIISVISISVAVSACWAHWLNYRLRMLAQHRIERVLEQKLEILRDAINLGYSAEQLKLVDSLLDKIAERNELKQMLDTRTELATGSDEAESKEPEEDEELKSMDVEQAIKVIRRELERQ